MITEAVSLVVYAALAWGLVPLVQGGPIPVRVALSLLFGPAYVTAHFVRSLFGFLSLVCGWIADFFRLLQRML